MFILLAGALAVITALSIALPFLRARQGVESRAAYDAQAYRAQLDEVDQDLARGILTEAEAKAAKIEVSRRLLAASDAMEAEGAVPAASGAVRTGFGVAAALGVPLLAAVVYLSIGEPGRPDQPLASRTDLAAQMAQRPSQEQTEAILAEQGIAPEPVATETPQARQFADLIEQVEARLAERPGDAEGRLILARSLARVDRFGESWRHYATLIEGADEPTPDLYGEMVETMLLAANGYVSPEAEAAADAGARLAPSDPRFVHYKALALAQRGETEAALARWMALLEVAEPGTSWAPMVWERAAQASQELGLEPPERPAAAPRAPGPSQEEMRAASEMSEEDRTAMIEGMVSQLAGRLAENPEDLDGWLRLIRAYGVMGREEDRATAIRMARATFEDDDEALARIERAAQ